MWNILILVFINQCLHLFPWIWWWAMHMNYHQLCLFFCPGVKSLLPLQHCFLLHALCSYLQSYQADLWWNTWGSPPSDISFPLTNSMGIVIDRYLTSPPFACLPLHGTFQASADEIQVVIYVGILRQTKPFVCCFLRVLADVSPDFKNLLQCAIRLDIVKSSLF